MVSQQCCYDSGISKDCQTGALSVANVSFSCLIMASLQPGLRHNECFSHFGTILLHQKSKNRLL